MNIRLLKNNTAPNTTIHPSVVVMSDTQMTSWRLINVLVCHLLSRVIYIVIPDHCTVSHPL